MAQRVFVKVIGFTEVERHALNTVFRLSEQGETIYSPWETDAPQPAQMALIDGQSQEGSVEMASGNLAGLKLLWVGDSAPAEAVHVFHRPMAWHDVVQAMDRLFVVAEPLDFDLDFDLDAPVGSPIEGPVDIDFDLDLDLALPAAAAAQSGVRIDAGPDTEPAELEPIGAPVRRALIAAATLEERLYWRARLSLANLPLADEATTGAQALEMARTTSYVVVMVDFGLEDGGWPLVRALRGLHPAIPNFVVVKDRPATFESLRAKLNDVPVFLYKPLNPKRLNARLREF